MTFAKTLRQVHRLLAPIMLLPIVLTTLTGAVFQLADLLGQKDSVKWLMKIHIGNFGIIDLHLIYPFLNSLGLMVLVGTGIMMWLKPKRILQKRLNS